MSNEEQECILDDKYAQNTKKCKFIACLKYILDAEHVPRFLLDIPPTLEENISNFFNNYPTYLSPEENAYIDCIYDACKRDKNKAIDLLFVYVCACYDFIRTLGFILISRETFQRQIDKCLKIHVDYPFDYDDKDYQRRMEIVVTSLACIEHLKDEVTKNIDPMMDKIHSYIDSILLLKANYYKLYESKCYIIYNYVKYSSDIEAFCKNFTEGNVDILISLGQYFMEKYASYEKNRSEYEFIACVSFILDEKNVLQMMPTGNERTDSRLTETFNFMKNLRDQYDKNDILCIGIILNDEEFCINKLKSNFYIYNKFVYECDFKAGSNSREIVREFLRNNSVEDHHEDICILSDKYSDKCKKIAFIMHLLRLAYRHTDGATAIRVKDTYNYIDSVISKMPSINEVVKYLIKCFEENIVYFLVMIIIYHENNDDINKIVETDIEFEVIKGRIDSLIMTPDNTSHPSQDTQSSQNHQHAQLDALKKHAKVILQHANQPQNTRAPPQQHPPQQHPPPAQHPPQQHPPQQYLPQQRPSQQPQYVPSLQKTFGTIHKRDTRINKYDIM